MPRRFVHRVIEVVQRYGALGLPLRLALGAVATLVAGTGLGFVAEYAAYSWAIYYGLRPPLEGIPYLNLAVTALTVSVLLGGALVYLVVHMLASFVLQYLDVLISEVASYGRLIDHIAPSANAKTISGALIARYRQVTFRTAFLTSSSVATVVAASVFIAYCLRHNARPDVLQFALLTLGIFFALLVIWDKNVRVWIALIAVAIVAVGVPSAFFHVGVYDNLLRILGYGGGLPVSITVVEDRSSSGHQRTKLEGYLMLRTTSAVLVFEPLEHRIREIPIQQVLFLDHAAAPLNERAPRLPR